MASKKVKRDEYEKAASTSRSDDKLREEEQLGSNQPRPFTSKRKTKNLVKLLALFVGLGTIVYVISPYFDAPAMLVGPYDFQVFCPINKIPPNLLQDDPV